MAESGLRKIIQVLFQRNGIHFVGKDFHLFAIRYNEVNYDGIIIASVILAMIPGGVRLIGRGRVGTNN